MSWFLRIFFHLLYHSFAWSYDLVAAAVSGGHWKDWVRSVLPLIEGKDVLELGIGTGTLQAALIAAGYRTFGIDQSRHMLRIAKDKVHKTVQQPAMLVRGLAQQIPLSNSSMDTIVATFPSEYIAYPETLKACRRVLRPMGKLIVLLGVQVGGGSIVSILLRGIYRVTGQTLPDRNTLEESRVKLNEYGFNARIETIAYQQDLLTVIVAASDSTSQPEFLM
ncbi:MAG: methyltransferase domain-containing protein [Chloroflexi bacterium]|nr:MAG: methyltransferase domain-containing protein [Chloroflexota bacterium]